MATNVNNTGLSTARFNNQDVSLIRVNGVEVWSSGPKPGLYDADGNLLLSLTPDLIKSGYLRNKVNATSVTEVVFPDGVFIIGEGAFESFTNLKSISIPPSVIEIKPFAFLNTGLTTITFEGIKSWYWQEYSWELPPVGNDIIPNQDFSRSVPVWQLTHYEQEVDESCSFPLIAPAGLYDENGKLLKRLSITEVENGYGTGIDNSKIWYCVLPYNYDAEEPTKIGYSFGSNWSNLRYINIPTFVEVIKNDVFRSCSNLKNFTLPRNVKSIGKGSFYNCPKVLSITFEDTTTWYRTRSSTNFENKTGGEQTDVSNQKQNASLFLNTGFNYYWYKL